MSSAPVISSEQIHSVWSALAEQETGKRGRSPSEFSALCTSFSISPIRTGQLCSQGYFWTDDSGNYWRGHGKRRSAEIGAGEVAELIQSWVLEEHAGRAEEALLNSIASLPLDGRYRRQAMLTVRLGQREFRNRLLELYANECWISGCRVERVLQAAHIEPHSGCNNMTSNGILLRADLHNLYDADLMWIDPAGDGYHVRLSPELGESYGEIKDKLLVPPNGPSCVHPDRNKLLELRPAWY